MSKSTPLRPTNLTQHLPTSSLYVSHTHTHRSYTYTLHIHTYHICTCHIYSYLHIFISPSYLSLSAFELDGVPRNESLSVDRMCQVKTEQKYTHIAVRIRPLAILNTYCTFINFPTSTNLCSTLPLYQLVGFCGKKLHRKLP